MPPEIVELIERWDGQQVVCRYDSPSGAWMFIAMHSTTRGPAAGGTRMRTYEHTADGLADAMRLASAMTKKFAILSMPVGGGKGVLAVPTIPRGSARRELFARYAAMVETLGGGFITGPDMNLTIDDLELMRQHSTHIFGTSAGVQEGRSISDATALGVLGGIRACLRHVHGDATLVGRTVLVQGIGGVGGPLTKLLVAEGAEVLVSDVNDARIRTTVERLGVEPVPLEQVLTTQVDVLAPCATGGVVGPEDVPRLGARIVAGCANNPLRGDGTADALEAAGVLYAPDFVINAGGALHGIAVEGLGWSSAQVLKGIEAIGATLVEIFRTADAQGISTSTAAERLAAERLRAPAGHSLEPEATASA